MRQEPFHRRGAEAEPVSHASPPMGRTRRRPGNAPLFSIDDFCPRELDRSTHAMRFRGETVVHGGVITASRT